MFDFIPSAHRPDAIEGKQHQLGVPHNHVAADGPNLGIAAVVAAGPVVPYRIVRMRLSGSTTSLGCPTIISPVMGPTSG